MKVYLVINDYAKVIELLKKKKAIGQLVSLDWTYRYAYIYDLST